MWIKKLKKSFIRDKKGFFSIIDGILAISILFIGLLIFNPVLNFYTPNPFEETYDSKLANNAIELMTLKIDENNNGSSGNSYSIL